MIYITPGTPYYYVKIGGRLSEKKPGVTKNQTEFPNDEIAWAAYKDTSAIVRREDNNLTTQEAEQQIQRMANIGYWGFWHGDYLVLVHDNDLLSKESSSS